MDQYLVDVTKSGRDEAEGAYEQIVRNLSSEDRALVEMAENLLTSEQKEMIASSPKLKFAQRAYRAILLAYSGVDISHCEGIAYRV